MTRRRCPSTERRRLLRGLGATSVLSLAGCVAPGSSRRREEGVYEWSGIGFGTAMSMEIHGVDEATGEQLGEMCESAIADLEGAFSLYRDDSELSRLNRERVLKRPSPVFRQLLDLSIDLQEETLGYYEPAIHGAWEWLRERGFRIPPDESAQWISHCEAADCSRVVRAADGSVRLGAPLTRLSMNAIGQGFLADRVARGLRERGVGSALLHLGETVAIGHHPSGRHWRLAVAGTGRESGSLGQVELADAGLAVSVNEPTRILIDPVGHSLLQLERVAAVVSSRGAAVADAHATAFAIAPARMWPTLASALQRSAPAKVRVWQGGRLLFKA